MYVIGACCPDLKLSERAFHASGSTSGFACNAFIAIVAILCAVSAAFSAVGAILGRIGAFGADGAIGPNGGVFRTGRCLRGMGNRGSSGWRSGCPGSRCCGCHLRGCGAA